MAAKIVVYRGVKYRRYEGRRYYNPGGGILERGGTSLHRQVWLDAGNKIPSGWHIHHIDHDVDNNEIGNLVCLPPKEHQREHMEERLGPSGDLTIKLTAWRASQSGKQTLKSNAKKMRERTPTIRRSCGNCGSAFETRHHQRLYCSDACSDIAGGKQSYKTCPICHRDFWSRKSRTKEVKTCLYSCGWRSEKEVPVYNLTVGEAHLFFANGILSSNTNSTITMLTVYGMA